MYLNYAKKANDDEFCKYSVIQIIHRLSIKVQINETLIFMKYCVPKMTRKSENQTYIINSILTIYPGCI